MFRRLCQLISLILTGLLAGLFTGRWLGAPASKEYSGPVFTEVQQRMDASVGQVAPLLIFGAIGALAVTLVAIRDFRNPQFLLVAAALVLVIVGTISTQLVNVPINDEINSWTINSPPADWADKRERWETFHVVRTVVTLLALGAVAAAVTVVRPRSAAGKSTARRTVSSSA
jgi:uncharacterized membrane protein